MISDRIWNDCPWHPVLRWLLFLPVGFIVTSIVQGVLRLANTDTPFIAECLARTAEPWTGLLPALWVLPRFNRAFILLATATYLGVQATMVVFSYSMPEFSQQRWADATLSVIAVASALGTAIYAWHQRYSGDSHAA